MFGARGLYAVTDGPRADLHEAVHAALVGGARLVQYRDKTKDPTRRKAEAEMLVALCADHGIPLIINDDLDLAHASGAAGVHLGADDKDIEVARSRLGPSAIIGVSCYDSLGRARQMAARGADYVAFGAFFPSPTKPYARCANLELLRESRTLHIPRVAIGGITHDNAPALIDAGADCIAVISSLFGATDIKLAAQRFSTLFP